MIHHGYFHISCIFVIKLDNLCKLYNLFSKDRQGNKPSTTANHSIIANSEYEELDVLLVLEIEIV